MLRILIADDHDVARSDIRALLENHAGWQVCGEAATGREALARAIELMPDLLVLDFAMPGLNGLQVAEQISRACPNLPIILHTIHDFPEMIAEAKRVGIREVVSKGDTAARLLDTIESLLPEKSSAAAAASALVSSPQSETASAEEVIDKLKPPN